MNLKNWKTQIRKGLLEIAILNLLNHNIYHGYEIVQILKRNQKLKILQIREGNLYSILSRLQANGLISIFFETSKGGPQRKLFKLTELGQNTLNKMNTHLDKIIASMRIVKVQN